jgi:hypothetical protein
MKHCLIALLWAFIANSCLAQEFQFSLGTDYNEIIYSSIQLPDKSYISCGQAAGYGAGGLNMMATRTNSIGERMWTKVYTSGDSEDMRSITQGSDGSIFSCGYTYGPSGNIQMTLQKINPDGSMAFSKQMGGPTGEVGEAIVATDDGGFAIVGYANSYNEATTADCLLSRFDGQGNLLWATGFGTEFGDNPKSLGITEDGHFLVAASYTPIPGQGLKAMAYTLDQNGNFLNALHVGHGEEMDLPRGIIELNGGLLVFGETYNTASGMTDVFFVHTDVEFNVIWQKIFGSDGFEHITSAIADDEGNFTVCGQTTTIGAGGVDGYIAQFNSSGEIGWMKTYGGESKDVFFQVIPTSDDGFLLSGYNRSFTTSFSNGWVIKTNERGDCACNQSATEILPIIDVVLDFATPEIESYAVDEEPTDWLVSVLDANDIGLDLMCSFGIEDDDTDSEEEVTAVSEAQGQMNFQAYPNPTEGMVYLSMPNTLEERILEVYSISGLLITRKRVPPAHEGIFPLDLSNLGGGVYIIQMTWSEGVYSKRLTIN